MISHLEPDILECKVKRALENITMKKASGCDGISAELLYPDPHRRRPRFELPESAGAGPRQESYVV